MMYKYILFTIIAYLLGSIPTSFWIGKLFFNTDVRNHGSKSSGATNTLRVLGLKVAIPVLIFDVIKGYLAVKLIYFSSDIDPQYFIRLEVIFGLSAVIGHIFPVFAGFKGGKGVATIAGILLAINPYTILISLAVFVIIVSITKMVSVGSILAALSLPLQFYLLIQSHDIFYYIFPFSIFLIVAITHIENIKRIIAGKENTISFKKKKDSYD